MSARSWWQRLTGAGSVAGDQHSSQHRGVGPGGSAHATSAHLWFGGLGPGPWTEVSATFEVLEEPSIDRLYFWALQASFIDASGRSYGAAHTGLQYNPRHPSNRAVNWGGYGTAADVTSVLNGTRSDLPGIAGDENTRNFAWRTGVRYRFTIDRGPRGWRSTVTDLDSGAATVIRELFADGDRLNGFVVWMEIFAPCDAPRTIVRWSDLEVADRSRGQVRRPTSVTTNFPDQARDCVNNDSRLDDIGLLQLTNDHRTSRTGQVLTLPD
jgi:hypothetical protein